MKKSKALKNERAWVYVVGAIVALIIAVIAGLHYFGKI
jgi:hypothetical protein